MFIIEDLKQLLQVHDLILTQTTGTPEEFASVLNVSRRKMYYLLEIIKGLGAEVVYSRANGTFYYQKPFDLSAITIAAMASTTGTARGRTQGS